MKELSIEEKAKAYDKVLEWATEAHKVCDGMLKEDLEHLFPELKESEDEKMANIIREAFATVTSENTLGKYGLSHQDVSDWLEKQGGHAKFINGIQVGDKVTHNEDGVLVNLSQLNRVAKKQGEQKKAVFTIFRVGDIIRRKEDGLEAKVIDVYNGVATIRCEDWDRTILDNEWELVEQNPAWSEEDINMFGSILSTLGICANNPQIPADVRSIHKKEELWFNELYHRAQPKQEWSEEDENIRLHLIDYLYGKSRLAKDRENGINWLKSLRPRNKWKPSDEQIEALLKLEEMHVLEHEKNQENAHLYMVVKSLREQLKKLREE